MEVSLFYLFVRSKCTIVEPMAYKIIQIYSIQYKSERASRRGALHSLARGSLKPRSAELRLTRRPQPGIPRLGTREKKKLQPPARGLLLPRVRRGLTIRSGVRRRRSLRSAVLLAAARREL